MVGNCFLDLPIGQEKEDAIFLTYFSQTSGQLANIQKWDGQQWQDLDILRSDVVADSQILKSALAKRKSIPNELKVKGGAQFAVLPGQTNYFRSTIKYQPGTKGEFWLEALGDKGGYGLLDPWYNSSWGYRIKLAVANAKVDADLTNFPVYVNLDDLPDATFWAHVKAACADVRITNSDGQTEMPREIVSCDTGAKTGEMHFQADALANASDTNFYIYYGNSSVTEPAADSTYGSENVWNDGGSNYFKLVQHLNESSGAGNYLLDSTTNDNDGAPAGTTPTYLSVAKLGGGWDFAGANQERVETPDSASLQVATALTAEVWAKIDSSTSPDHNPLLWKGSQLGWGALYNYRIVNSSGSMSWGVTCGAVEGWFGGGSAAIGSWAHYAITFDGATANAYINGVNVGNSTTCSGQSLNVMATSPVRSGFGYRQTGSEETHMDGAVDEIRISNFARAITWFSTEYNNHNSTADFYSLTDEEAATTGATQIGRSLTNFMNDSSLVLYYSFDGPTMNGIVVSDLSDSGINGIMAYGPKAESGISGQALSFDGVDDYVDLQAFALPADKTISFWIKHKITGTNGSWETILECGSDAPWIGFHNTGVSTPPKIEIYDNNPLTSTTFSQDVWYHVVYISSSAGNVSQFYVNGVTDGSPGTANTQTSNACSLGDSNDSATNSVIDDFRIYNRALSQAEITNLYNVGAARIKINSTASAPASPASGLVGYWSFNGADMDWSSNTAYDRSGTSPANNGTITNMSRVSSPVEGISGQALSFDGVDDYVDIASQDALNSYPITVSFWLKTNDANGGIVNKYFSGSANGWNIFASDNNLCAWYFKSGAAYVWDGTGCSLSSAGYNNNSWHHIIFVVDSAGGRLYMDGTQKSTFGWTGTAGATNTSQNVSIGLYPDGGPGYINGLIDETRVYNRALSVSEIQELYNSGAKRLKNTTN